MGVGGAFAFTTPDGRCNTQSFSSGQGSTAAFGPASANVNGAVSADAGCAGELNWMLQVDAAALSAEDPSHLMLLTFV